MKGEKTLSKHFVGGIPFYGDTRDILLSSIAVSTPYIILRCQQYQYFPLCMYVCMYLARVMMAFKSQKHYNMCLINLIQKTYNDRWLIIILCYQIFSACFSSLLQKTMQ